MKRYIVRAAAMILALFAVDGIKHAFDLKTGSIAAISAGVACIAITLFIADRILGTTKSDELSTDAESKGAN